MAVTFTDKGALATITSGANLTVTSPTVASGDYILIACLLDKALGTTWTPPDGTWTEIISGDADCTTGSSDFSYAIFWKRVTADTGATGYLFQRNLSGAQLGAGIISTWAGAVSSGDPLDASSVGVTVTAANADNVSFPAFDPTETNSHIIFVAYYGNDLTTFAAAMSGDTNPDCTTRFDVETSNGTDCSIALTSGDTTDGSNIAARTWASASTADAGSAGIVFGLKPAPPAVGGQHLLALMGVGT